MTRLTLEWHLRGIIEGTTEPVCVRQDIEYGVGERYWPTKKYYADPNTEDNREQRSQAEAGSYTTGFTQDSGDFCDAFDVPALKALNADDTVAYLDAVAHDPVKRFQERYDVAALLDYHIWPDSRSVTNPFHDVTREDIDVSEWIYAGMTGQSIGPTYFAMDCANPNCMEGECLSDIDKLRETGVSICSVCGTEQPVPEYPD